MERQLDRSRFIILAAAVLVVGHELVLRIGYGPGADASSALKATSHGLAWLLQATAALLATAGLLIVMAARIRGLRARLFASVGRVPTPGRPSRRQLLVLWERLFAVALIGFILQENLEHGLVHHHLPGLSMLYGGQYVFTIPVFAALAFAAALVASLVGRELATLEEAVAHVERCLPRATLRLAPVSADPDRRLRALLIAAAIPRRGPPLVCA